MEIKKKSSYHPRVVMSIHGMWSNGGWQKICSDALNDMSLNYQEFDYKFKIHPWNTDHVVEKFRKWYFEIVKKSTNNIDLSLPFYRPSIVAHNLGTWIIAKALLKYDDIKFDKIFIHGGIIPSDFDWFKLILKDQVGQVITETSKKDWLIRFSWLVTKSGSPCGRFGFKQKSTFSKEIDVTDFSHSDFNDKNRFEKQFLLHLFDEPVQLKVVHGGDLDMRTILKYFKDTELIDKEAYGNDYNNSKPVTLDMAKQWALMEKNIWSFMIETFNETVVGYFNVMAVDDATMDKFVLGQISEADILANNIKRFEQGTHLNIIIMAVSLDTQTQERWGGVIGSKPGELITAALSDKLVNITNQLNRQKGIRRN